MELNHMNEADFKSVYDYMIAKGFKNEIPSEFQEKEVFTEDNMLFYTVERHEDQGLNGVEKNQIHFGFEFMNAHSDPLKFLTFLYFGEIRFDIQDTDIDEEEINGGQCMNVTHTGCYLWVTNTVYNITLDQISFLLEMFTNNGIQGRDIF